MKNHPFTLAMPPNNITILVICTVLCICAGGGGMQASTPPHTKHKANIIASRIAISYLHTDTRESVLQYYVACKGLNVTTTIHTAHAQKHFSPETEGRNTAIPEPPPSDSRAPTWRGRFPSHTVRGFDFCHALYSIDGSGQPRCQVPNTLGNLAWGCHIPWGAKFPVTPVHNMTQR